MQPLCSPPLHWGVGTVVDEAPDPSGNTPPSGQNEGDGATHQCSPPPAGLGLGLVVGLGWPWRGTPTRGVLCELDFFFKGPALRTAPRDHQLPTTNRQPRPTPNHQPPPTASRDQPPTANHRSPTANRRQPPPTATNRQSPTANRQPPPTANRQSPPTMAEHLSHTRLFCKTAVQELFCPPLKEPPDPHLRDGAGLTSASTGFRRKKGPPPRPRQRTRGRQRLQVCPPPTAIPMAHGPHAEPSCHPWTQYNANRLPSRRPYDGAWHQCPAAVRRPSVTMGPHRPPLSFTVPDPANGFRLLHPSLASAPEPDTSFSKAPVLDHSSERSAQEGTACPTPPEPSTPIPPYPTPPYPHSPTAPHPHPPTAPHPHTPTAPHPLLCIHVESHDTRHPLRALRSNRLYPALAWYKGGSSSPSFSRSPDSTPTRQTKYQGMPYRAACPTAQGHLPPPCPRMCRS